MSLSQDTLKKPSRANDSVSNESGQQKLNFDSNFSDQPNENILVKDLSTVKRKILSLVKENVNGSLTKTLAKKLYISFHNACYHVRGLIKKGFLIKKNGKIYLNLNYTPVTPSESSGNHQNTGTTGLKKSLTTHGAPVISSENADKSKCKRFDHLTFTIPVSSFTKSFFKHAKWSKDPYHLQGNTIYTMYDVFKLSNLAKKLHDIVSKYVHFTNEFWHCQNKSSLKMIVKFNKFFFIGDYRDAFDSCVGILNLYLLSLQDYYNSDNLFFHLDGKTFVHSKYEVKSCNAPKSMKGITYKGVFFKIDHSDGKNKDEIEHDSLQHAELMDHLPNIIEDEVRPEVESNSNGLVAVNSTIKEISERINVTISALQLLNSENKLTDSRVKRLEATEGYI